jgi:hypothetical protein
VELLFLPHLGQLLDQEAYLIRVLLSEVVRSPLLVLALLLSLLFDLIYGFFLLILELLVQAVGLEVVSPFRG